MAETQENPFLTGGIWKLEFNNALHFVTIQLDLFLSADAEKCIENLNETKKTN